MSAVDRSPTTLSRWASILAAFLALVSSGFYSWPALAVGTVGVAVLLFGLVRGRRAAISTGAFALFAGTMAAAAQGAPVVSVLVGVTSSVVAWDVGGNAIGVGDHLGRDADTLRLEVVHVLASLAVGVFTAGLGLGIYRAGTGGQPVVALVFLVLAAVSLVEALS